jgi:hypothetical protein
MVAVDFGNVTAKQEQDYLERKARARQFYENVEKGKKQVLLAKKYET